MKKLLFNQLLLPSVLDGSKTMTRRESNPQPTELPISWDLNPLSIHPYYDDCSGSFYYNTDDGIEYIKPRYKVGETVYIPEPYYIINSKGGLMDMEDKKIIRYKHGTKYANYEWSWQNSMFMPEKYARTFAEITNVRVERLQSISESDCFREGVMEHTQFDGQKIFFSNPVQYGRTRAGINKPFKTPQQAFAALIDKVCKKGTWERNPFVEVITYKLIEK